MKYGTVSIHKKYYSGRSAVFFSFHAKLVAWNCGCFSCFHLLYSEILSISLVCLSPVVVRRRMTEMVYILSCQLPVL
jgi:hypothetical protein